MTTVWEAVYDDSTLRQFNVDGVENSFSAIKLDELWEFRLLHNNVVLSLFTRTGTFGLNGFLYDTDISNIREMKYRLIYFARRKKIMGNGIDTNTYFMGFQITKDGKNYKRMISVCNNQIQLVNK